MLVIISLFQKNSYEGGVLIPEDFLRIPNSGKVEMRCQVIAPDGDQIYLDWKRSDHRALPKGSTVHNGVLSIPTVDKSAAGEYICLGLNPAGTVIFKAKSHLEIICGYSEKYDINEKKKKTKKST